MVDRTRRGGRARRGGRRGSRRGRGSGSVIVISTIISRGDSDNARRGTGRGVVTAVVGATAIIAVGGVVSGRTRHRNHQASGRDRWDLDGRCSAKNLSNVDIETRLINLWIVKVENRIVGTCGGRYRITSVAFFDGVGHLTVLVRGSGQAENGANLEVCTGGVVFSGV